MEGLEGFQEPVLNPQVVAILDSNIGIDYWSWVIYSLVFLIALVVIILTIVFVVRKIRKNSFSPEFKELINRGELAIKNRDFPLASKIYMDMKKMSERTFDKRMAVASLEFFKKVLALKNSL